LCCSCPLCITKDLRHLCAQRCQRSFVWDLNRI
jgi:hypothetical protein